MTQVAKVPPSNGATPSTLVSIAAPSKKPEKKEIQEELPPLEDRLHRLNQLFHLQQKYSKLQDSLQKLNDFEIKKDGERSSIRIQDDNRNDFATYNPEIVQEVTEFLKRIIKEKIKALEPKLKW
jgi:flagellar motor protein MotB